MTNLEKLIVLLGIAFFFLINFPLVEIFNRAILIAGIPLLILYLFGIWILAIILLYFFARRLESRVYPGPKKNH